MNNKKSFWIIKQEPSQYNWKQFEKDRETYWDGVRNYQARNNLKNMKKLAQELNLPLVCTNDAHYSRKEHWEAHEVTKVLQVRPHGIRVHGSWR